MCIRYACLMYMLSVYVKPRTGKTGTAALRIFQVLLRSDVRPCIVWVTMRHATLPFLYLLTVAGTSRTTTNALVLEPGVGLRSRDGSTHVVLFEHTPEHGTGGLVLNQATPLRLKDLEIPLFHEAFAENSLMLGGGLRPNDKETNVAITEMAPWFWLHTVKNVPNSIALQGADGPLFLGGSIEDATNLIQKGEASPLDFKFFYKYISWRPGELVEEIACKDLWTDVGPMQPSEAVQTYSFPRVV